MGIEIAELGPDGINSIEVYVALYRDMIGDYCLFVNIRVKERGVCRVVGVDFGINAHRILVGYFVRHGLQLLPCGF